MKKKKEQKKKLKPTASIDYTLIDFLEQVVVVELKKHQNMPYSGFAYLAINIELIGSLFDNLALTETGKSKPRFESAIKKAFGEVNSKYKDNNISTILYEVLRCGFAHIGMPSDNTLQLNSGKSAATSHLINSSGETYCNFDQFVEDFEKVVQKIKSNKINGIDRNKLSIVVFRIKNKTPSHIIGNLQTSGTPQTQ